MFPQNQQRKKKLDLWIEFIILMTFHALVCCKKSTSSFFKAFICYSCDFKIFLFGSSLKELQACVENALLSSNGIYHTDRKGIPVANYWNTFQLLEHSKSFDVVSISVNLSCWMLYLYQLLSLDTHHVIFK